MRRLWLMVFFGLSVSMGASRDSAAPERTWTVDDQPVVGRLVSYRDGEATIEVEAGNTLRVHHSRLARADVVHIQAQRRLERRARQAERSPPPAAETPVQRGPANVRTRIVYVPYATADPTWPVRWDLYRAYNGLDIWPFSYRSPRYYGGLYSTYPVYGYRPVYYVGRPYDGSRHDRRPRR